MPFSRISRALSVTLTHGLKTLLLLCEPCGPSHISSMPSHCVDKNPSVRPIGICEVMQCIIAKAVLTITRGDIMEAAGPLQLCAGQPAGVEAASHAVRSWYDDEATEGVLLADGSNDFNTLNRQGTFHNVHHLCPSMAQILVNCYRESAPLFVDSSTLWSEEGTTQGDPLAMPLYAIASIPLIRIQAEVRGTKQVWYANDSTAAGSLDGLRN